MLNAHLGKGGEFSVKDNGLSLNHVLSWAHIRERLSKTLKEKEANGKADNKWIANLFTVDKEAWVNISPLKFIDKKRSRFTRGKHAGKSSIFKLLIAAKSEMR